MNHTQVSLTPLYDYKVMLAKNDTKVGRDSDNLPLRCQNARLLALFFRRLLRC